MSFAARCSEFKSLTSKANAKFGVMREHTKLVVLIKKDLKEKNWNGFH